MPTILRIASFKGNHWMLYRCPGHLSPRWRDAQTPCRPWDSEELYILARQDVRSPTCGWALTRILGRVLDRRPARLSTRKTSSHPAISGPGTAAWLQVVGSWAILNRTCALAWASPSSPSTRCSRSSTSPGRPSPPASPARGRLWAVRVEKQTTTLAN